MLKFGQGGNPTSENYTSGKSKSRKLPSEEFKYTPSADDEFIPSDEELKRYEEQMRREEVLEKKSKNSKYPVHNSPIQGKKKAPRQTNSQDRRTKRYEEKKISLKVDRDEDSVKNYHVLRNEIIYGYARLTDLDLIGKIKMSNRWKAKKTGKYEAKLKRIHEKMMKLENAKYNKLYRTLLNLAEPIQNGEVDKQVILLDKDFIQPLRYKGNSGEPLLKEVLAKSDFEGIRFTYQEMSKDWQLFTSPKIRLIIERDEYERSGVIEYKEI